jgi:hypothetical protein
MKGHALPRFPEEEAFSGRSCAQMGPLAPAIRRMIAAATGPHALGAGMRDLLLGGRMCKRPAISINGSDEKCWSSRMPPLPEYRHKTLLFAQPTVRPKGAEEHALESRKTKGEASIVPVAWIISVDESVPVKQTLTPAAKD